MHTWLDGLVPGYGTALMWTIFALVGLLILLVLIRIVRGLTFGTFVAGGRNRKARLAVMDATAVDSQRRLVLVRRDDVEHLILIGGPTDVVVEQNIRLAPAARRPAAEEHAAEPQHRAPQQQQAEPAQRQPAPQATPAARPQQAAALRPVPAPAPVHAAQRPVPAPQPQPQREPRFTPPPPAAPPPQAASVQTLRPVAAAAPAAKPDFDDSLLEELEVTLDREPKPAASAAPAQSAADRSLDEEMSRLLSDLSGPKR